MPIEKLGAKGRLTSPGVVSQNNILDLHTIQAIATAIGCMLKLDGKITSPKTLTLLVLRH